MKPSIIIALLIGGIVGFVVGNMFKSSDTSADSAPVAVKAAPGAVKPSPAREAPTPSRPSAAVGNADTTVFKVPIEASPVKGPTEALVTIVEFSDYQCPYCSRGHNTITQLEKEYAGKIRVVMKQHPLAFHKRAKPAALAALAAGKQGKYWEMHDLLFANQKDGLTDTHFEEYAQKLALNLNQWKADMKSVNFEKQIAKDTELAMQLGATGTPAFFINGRKLSGAQPLQNFKAIIDDELSKAQKMVDKGTPAKQVYAQIMKTAVLAPAPRKPPTGPPPAVKIDVPADSPVKGSKSAKVTIVEWSDFQCPFCSKVNPLMEQIKNTYGDQVRIVFRHLPLAMHDKAQLAAEASMAAHEQGKFWQYHDKLFANQQSLDRANLERFAQELGLNSSQFKTALDSGKFTQKVKQDAAQAQSVGVSGTPTFFINGQKFVGAKPFDAVKPVIDKEIAKADALLAKGTKPENLYAELQKEIAAPPSKQEKIFTDINLKGAPSKGPPNAPVTLVIFSDFQCPFCSRVLPTVKQIEEQYKGQVKIAFKHQPLAFHSNAKQAAIASMAAHEQGRFWQMHDKLFANQRSLDRDSLERYAKDLGLNMNKFKTAMDSNEFADYVDADVREATRVGATGTPTFFINGRSVVGAQPFDAFRQVIDEELAKE